MLNKHKNMEVHGHFIKEAWQINIVLFNFVNWFRYVGYQIRQLTCQGLSAKKKLDAEYIRSKQTKAVIRFIHMPEIEVTISGRMDNHWRENCKLHMFMWQLGGPEARRWISMKEEITRIHHAAEEIQLMMSKHEAVLNCHTSKILHWACTQTLIIGFFRH